MSSLQLEVCAFVHYLSSTSYKIEQLVSYWKQEALKLVSLCYRGDSLCVSSISLNIYVHT